MPSCARQRWICATACFDIEIQGLWNGWPSRDTSTMFVSFSFCSASRHRAYDSQYSSSTVRSISVMIL